MFAQWVGVLADVNNFGDTRSGSLAGPIGLVVILLLATGTFLLVRDMNSRLKRLPEAFDPPRPAAPPAPSTSELSASGSSTVEQTTPERSTVDEEQGAAS